MQSPWSQETLGQDVASGFLREAASVASSTLLPWPLHSAPVLCSCPYLSTPGPCSLWENRASSHLPPDPPHLPTHWPVVRTELSVKLAKATRKVGDVPTGLWGKHPSHGNHKLSNPPVLGEGGPQHPGESCSWERSAGGVTQCWGAQQLCLLWPKSATQRPGSQLRSLFT